MLGGTPGSSSSQVFMDGFKDGLTAYPALQLLRRELHCHELEPG